MTRPRQIPGTGLFVRGTGFDAEQIAGYQRDLKRLNDYIDYLNSTPGAWEARRERLKNCKRAPGPAAARAAASFNKGRR